MSEILNINGQPANGEAVELLKPNGQPVHPPEPEVDNFTKAIIFLYNSLTDDQKAILSAGIPLYAVLTQTPGTDGLNMRVFPAVPCRVDHKEKKVYRIENAKDENSTAGPVPDECRNPADTGAEGQIESGADSRNGEGPKG